MNTKERAWRLESHTPSLPEIHSSLPIPRTPGFLRKLIAFAGPGFLVAVGYMDPGNWATDLAAGSRYNYRLLFVIMLSNLLAILLQSLCIKLGVVTGRDLAQACRDHFSTTVSIFLWILAEIAIAACDLAEVVGSAIALQLLFHIPLLWGVCITALDVLLILFLENKGFRYIEAIVVTLVATIGLCFSLEILFSRPELTGIFSSLFIPSTEILHDREMLYIAIGILGATVMPHNLYLHSAVVQTRDFDRTPEGKREAIKYCNIDSAVALTFALFVNAAILIVSGGDVLSERQSPGGGDRRCLPVAFAVARRRGSEYDLCACAVGIGAELHADGDACGSDHHGGLHQYSGEAVAAKVDHPSDCDHSRRSLSRPCAERVERRNCSS